MRSREQGRLQWRESYARGRDGAPLLREASAGRDPQRVMPIRQARPSYIYRTTGVVPEAHLLRVKITKDINRELAGQWGISKAALVRGALAELLDTSH